MIEKIEKIKRQIIDIERKIEREEDIREIVALKKQKIKLESELVELMEQEFGEANDAGVISLAEAIQLYEAMPKKPVYSTGIEALDKHFGGGLAMSQLVIAAGEKGAGKTLLTMQILKNVSRGWRTMLFSLEMPYWKIVERFQKQRLDERILTNLSIADKKFTLEAIESIIRIEAAKGTKFFVIDSLMKIATLKNFSSTAERYSHISATLSRLAVELDVIIFLIAQMSKEDTKNGHKGLKYSGDLEYDADVILYILKDKNVLSKRELICDKNRQNGEEFKETVYIDKNSLEFKSEPAVEVVYNEDKTQMEVI